MQGKICRIREMFKQFRGMFESNGVVDISFKTDADHREMGVILIRQMPS